MCCGTELLTIAQLPRSDARPSLIVYADPQLSVDEARLFDGSEPPVQSFGEWLVGDVA